MKKKKHTEEDAGTPPMCEREARKGRKEAECWWCLEGCVFEFEKKVCCVTKKNRKKNDISFIVLFSQYSSLFYVDKES